MNGELRWRPGWEALQKEGPAPYRGLGRKEQDKVNDSNGQ